MRKTSPLMEQHVIMLHMYYKSTDTAEM